LSVASLLLASFSIAIGARHWRSSMATISRIRVVFTR
jgi:hypothetical protein